MMATPTFVEQPEPSRPQGSALQRAFRALVLEQRMPYSVRRMMDRALTAIGFPYRTIRINNQRMRIRRRSMDGLTVQQVAGESEYTSNGFDVKPGSIVVDVGANIGAFTVLAAKFALHVYAFEPSSSELRMLRHNVELNGLKNVTAVHAALSGSNGMVELRLGNDSVANTIRTDRGVGDVATERVAALSLETVFRELDIERCDFLKIDCEGAEYDMLYKTPHDILERVQRIALEWHVGVGEDKRAAADPLAAFLEREGFEIVLYEDYVGTDCGVIRAIRPGQGGAPDPGRLA